MLIENKEKAQKLFPVGNMFLSVGHLWVVEDTELKKSMYKFGNIDGAMTRGLKAGNHILVLDHEPLNGSATLWTWVKVLVVKTNQIVWMCVDDELLVEAVTGDE